MRFKFNPLAGQLDLVGDGRGTFNKSYTTVDSGFLTPRTVTLVGEPSLDSEQVFFNGLLIEDTCYNIVNNELIFEASMDIRVGDFIDIRYVT